MGILESATARITAATVASILGVSGALAETTLKFIPSGDIQVFDPIWTTAGETKNHGYLIYDTLVGVDADGVIQPQMLESYSLSEDLLTYTFTLRDGMTWHDGTKASSFRF